MKKGLITKHKKNFFEEVQDYFPTYLLAHQHPLNKLVHVWGNLFIVCLSISITIEALTSGRTYGLLLLPFILICGIYVFVWPAHIFIEKNKPATFTVSRWITKACDWVMIWKLLTRQIKLDGRHLPKDIEEAIRLGIRDGFNDVFPNANYKNKDEIKK